MCLMKHDYKEVDSMEQKWIDGKQYVCVSMDEIFTCQDKLDEIENDKSQAWDLFNEFLDQMESHLELSPEFIKELEEIEKKLENEDYSDFVKAEDLLNYLAQDMPDEE